MSLEQQLAENTAALNANTAALLKVIALSQGAAPAAEADPEVETPTPAKKPKKEKVVAAPAVEDETPAAPAAETTSGEPLNRDAAILKITEIVKTAFTNAGPNLSAKKDEYTAIREKFGVAKASELKDDQIPAFIAAVESL